MDLCWHTLSVHSMASSDLGGHALPVPLTCQPA
jgi:hypothetical protein